MLEEIKNNLVGLEFVKWADEDSKTLLSQNVDCIKEALSDVNANVKKNFIKIGYYLWAIKRGELYQFAHKPGEQYCTYYKFYSDSFTNFIHDYFGFSKTTTYNLIAIMEKFAPGCLDGKCLSEYEDFSYSQLCEMVSMSDVQLSKVRPSMTIREIRELKKTEEVSGDNLLLVKDEPSKPKQGLEESVHKPFFDLKIKKDEFRSHCKNFFEKFKYELKLHDRKQGGWAFAGVFFAYLEEKGFFNAEI